MSCKRNTLRAEIHIDLKSVWTKTHTNAKYSPLYESSLSLCPAVVGQAKLLPPERMKHSIKLVDDQMNWCDSAIEVRPP